MAKTTQDHHNDGQTDASNGEYNPPSGTLNEIFDLLPTSGPSNAEKNEAYNHGHQNTKNQK